PEDEWLAAQPSQACHEFVTELVAESPAFTVSLLRPGCSRGVVRARRHARSARMVFAAEPQQQYPGNGEPDGVEQEGEDCEQGVGEAADRATEECFPDDLGGLQLTVGSFELGARGNRGNEYVGCAVGD